MVLRASWAFEVRGNAGRERVNKSEIASLVADRTGVGRSAAGSFGVHRLVERCKAAVPSLSNRRVTPHVIRHTCACHLLRSGVDLNTIRAWLGHVNLDTTNIYAQVDLDLKIRAMQQCDTVATQPRKVWEQDHGLMEYLDSL